MDFGLPSCFCKHWTCLQWWPVCSQLLKSMKITNQWGWVVAWDHTLQSTGVNTHSTQRPRGHFWLRLAWSSTLIIRRMKQLLSALLWVGCVMVIMTLCDHYGILWVVCISWIYNALWALTFVDYGCLCLSRFIELEWARNNPCMGESWNQTRDLTGYLVRCAIMAHHDWSNDVLFFGPSDMMVWPTNCNCNLPHLINHFKIKWSH